jgi:hypothetical protein
MLENKDVKTLGLQSLEVADEWRKLHNKKLYYLYLLRPDMLQQKYSDFSDTQHGILDDKQIENKFNKF